MTRSAREGRVDLVVNNAGRGIWGDAREFDASHWREIVDANLWGAIHGSRAAFGLMAEQGFGQIVNVASLAGLVAAPTIVPYATAKHGVVGLTLALRAEGEDLGVRASVVCPGPVRSGFHENLIRVDAGAAPRAPADGMDAPQAALAILRGMARNQRIIVFPRRARWLWWLSRFAPSRIAAMNRGTVRRMRDRQAGQ